MGKLLERLMDPVRSGVYRIGGVDEVVDALRGSALRLSRIAAPAKGDLIRELARQLEFPDWFGGNWDALEDCLTDLSWTAAAGHVLLFEQFDSLPLDDRGILIEVLTAAAEFWATQGKPFFAVFVDPARSLKLADLFRQA